MVIVFLSELSFAAYKISWCIDHLSITRPKTLEIKLVLRIEGTVMPRNLNYIGTLSNEVEISFCQALR